MEFSRILIGGMRFTDRETAVATIHRAIDSGFNYVDTSPCYCRKDEVENSESWVGTAVADPAYRERVMISTKCSPGNGGLLLGEFRKEGGFGVRSMDELRQTFEQSLRRLELERVDYYHLWTTHTNEQFQEALKPGGWLDGVRAMGDKWDHLGVTTHADSDVIIGFLESGLFETVTLPLNVINRTRMKAVDYCKSKGIRVIAMNPFGGGLLAMHEELKELALRYLLLLGVHPLIGFSCPEEVDYAKWVLDTMPEFDQDLDQVLARVEEISKIDEPHCTACGYCLPCPESINIGESLAYYNLYKYMGSDQARTSFQNKQWYDGLKLDRCTACGQCAERCPNNLDVPELIRDACEILYEN